MLAMSVDFRWKEAMNVAHSLYSLWVKTALVCCCQWSKTLWMIDCVMVHWFLSVLLTRTNGLIVLQGQRSWGHQNIWSHDDMIPFTLRLYWWFCTLPCTKVQPWSFSQLNHSTVQHSVVFFCRISQQTFLSGCRVVRQLLSTEDLISQDIFAW